MKFLYNSFKAKKKQIVKVTFDQPTKVKLMTSYDLNKYKQGRTHRYRGGFFEESPVYFRLPSDGIWNAVVEKGTTQNEIVVQASVNILPPDKSIKDSAALDAPKLKTNQNSIETEQNEAAVNAEEVEAVDEDDSVEEEEKES